MQGKRHIGMALRIAMALLATTAGLLSTSCIREWDYYNDPAARLMFSEDTVSFDTVFTQMGTTTHVLTVYNPYSEAIRIDQVTLRGGRQSRFRLNVDGDTSMVARGLEIAGKDSLFVFVQANINPNDALSPFLVEDAIVFSFNAHEQVLPLMAYGRNAVYHKPTGVLQDQFGNQYPSSVIDCATWDHTRPHIILGYAMVYGGETLHLQGGDKLYFANDSYLLVYEGSTLDARGSPGNPVLFSSVRHDGYYDTLPGQWGYVWLSAGSVNNHIEWARIENGTVGVLVDTNVNDLPTLEISNTVIENHSMSGLVGQGAYVLGNNLLIDNCGITVLSLQYGGLYAFDNSTFANYWHFDRRTAPAVVLNNYYLYRGDTVGRSLSADLRNCIIYGSYTGRDSVGELMIDRCYSSAFYYGMRHCLVKSWRIDTTRFRNRGMVWNQDPKFVQALGRNFHLRQGSPAIGAGEYTNTGSLTDLDGMVRENPPAIGAYEYSAAQDTGSERMPRHPVENRQETLKNNTICTITSEAALTRRHQPTRSWTVEAWVTSSKSPSTPIRRLKTSTR